MNLVFILEKQQTNCQAFMTYMDTNLYEIQSQLGRLI